MVEKIPRNPNKHHTLYYRRDFLKYPHTSTWREHPVMIVPLPYYEHEKLHQRVLPADGLPTEELTKHALYLCRGIQAQSDSITRLEAFTSLRDELRQHHMRNKRSYLGHEALKYSEQFTNQIAFMSEVPILGTDWDI